MALREACIHTARHAVSGGGRLIGCEVAASLQVSVWMVLVEAAAGAVGLGAGRAGRPVGDAAPSRDEALMFAPL